MLSVRTARTVSCSTMTGSWNSSARLKASTVVQKQSVTLVGEEFHDVGGRRDRVPSVAAATCRHGSQRDRVITGQNDAALELRRPHLERATLTDLLLDIRVAQVDGLQVLVENLLALLGQLR